MSKKFRKFDARKVEQPKRFKRFGYLKDKPDPRDFIHKPKLEHIMARPAMYDPRKVYDQVFDQGNLGSCTANGIGGSVQWLYKWLKNTSYMPSRLMIYYDERAMEGSIGEDAGAEIRDGIKSMNTQGACDETVWPYDITKFTQKPPAAAYTEGKLHEALKYERMTQSDVQLETRLSMGYPVIVGITVFDSFMTDAVTASGVVPMPNAGLPWQKNMPGPVENIQGGHCVLVVGYLRSTRQFIVRNSWGTSWGQNGYCLMPYSYICCSDLGSDYWTITIVE